MSDCKTAIPARLTTDMRVGYLISALVLGSVAILGLQHRERVADWLGLTAPPPVIEPTVTVVPPARAPLQPLVLPKPVSVAAP